MTTEIEQKIRDIVKEQLDVDEDKIVADAHFVDDLGADSLDLVELVMAFEEAFGCEIPDEDAEKIVKFSDAISYVKEHGSN